MSERKCKAWVFVKSVTVRKTPDSNSEVVEVLKFGRSVETVSIPDPVNGRILVEFRKYDNKHRPLVRGWAAMSAFTKTPVEDRSCLWYENISENRIPATDRMHKKLIGVIEPGEYVTVLARVGGWCLTNKGWTRGIFLRKSRDIFSQDVMDTVLYGTLSWAVRDYRTTVKRLKYKMYKNPHEFCMLVEDLDEIGVFFLDKENPLRIDSVPGRQRFNDLNEELGVTNQQIKDWLDQRDRIMRTRKYKKT